MKTTNISTVIIALATLIIGVLLGWLLFGRSEITKSEEHIHTDSSVTETIWTCSMHPQIRTNEQGKCPICGMDLVPLESFEVEFDPLAVSMSPTAMKLAHVETIIVGNGNPEKSIRLNGKVQADERLVFTESSHIPGRIEKLTVNFTGDYVSKGQVIAYVYSPDLVTAQEELFEARKSMESQPALFQSAIEKLKNWKLTDQQIEQILTSNKPFEQFPIQSGVSGFVTKKMVNPGDYVKQGQVIYEIADFSRVWVLFEVYESELTWIRKGEKVSYTVQSLPGETFHGTISYVDPVINPKTRVAQARVEVRNTGLKLKPEMFASGNMETTFKSKPSTIIIPKTAVMWTGKRSVVYVMNRTAQGVSFIMREVTLGPELGEGYLIESGLLEGEEIAVNGTFSIDAAAQLAGKPSMMNTSGGKVSTGHQHGETMHMQSEAIVPVTSQEEEIPSAFKEQLKGVYLSYLKVKDALIQSNAEETAEAAESVLKSLSEVKMNMVKGQDHMKWMEYLGVMEDALKGIESAENLEDQRISFSSLTAGLVSSIKYFSLEGEKIYYQYCPMAFNNKGDYWLSRSEKVENPYFGEAMLTCGAVVEVIK